MTIENEAGDKPGALLIRNADLVTMSNRGDLVGHDLLVSSGRIAAIDRDVPVPAELPADRVIDGRNLIVLPGLIDTHRHLWNLVERGYYSDATLTEYLGDAHARLRPRVTPQSIEVATHYGRLEALDYGITTLFEYGTGAMTPAHARASLSALHRAPGRSVFSYAIGYQAEWQDGETFRAIMDALNDLRTDELLADPQHLALAVSFVVGSRLGDGDLSRAIGFARENGLLMSTHAGIATGGAPPCEVAHLHRLDLLGPDIIYAHGCAFTDEELRLLNEYGGSVSVSPETELLHGMGWPATKRLIEAGLAPSVSVDGAGMIGGDLFHQARLALQVARGQQHGAAHERGTRLASNTITARDALGWITIDAARALRMDARLGSLEIGKEADLVLLDVNDPRMIPRAGDPATLALMFGQADMIRDVLVSGRFVKRNGTLVGVDHDTAARAMQETFAALFEAEAFRSGEKVYRHPLFG